MIGARDMRALRRLGLSAPRLSDGGIHHQYGCGGNCPCNPSIGGTAKGHSVREIDASLAARWAHGGRHFAKPHAEQGQGARPCIPCARRSTAGIQGDETQAGIAAEGCSSSRRRSSICTQEGGNWVLTTRMGAQYTVQGGGHRDRHLPRRQNFLWATSPMRAGRTACSRLPFGRRPEKLGLRLRRFKTGTPARVLRSSIDFPGSGGAGGRRTRRSLLLRHPAPGQNQAVCHVSWTNGETKRIILENIHRSPSTEGRSRAWGPLLPQHRGQDRPLCGKSGTSSFIEPCGQDTEEMYLQGMSSSCRRTCSSPFTSPIKGLEHAEIMRPAYAIEYDCVDPLRWRRHSNSSISPGLYGAGQFNGSSGYEEAAAQGWLPASTPRSQDPGANRSFRPRGFLSGR